MTNSFKTEITREELNEYPLQGYEGQIELIEDIDKVDDAVEEIKGENLLGVDTETKPMFKRGQFHEVALLQIATSKKVYLFRLCKIGLPECLTEILSDDNITKVGIAFKDDVTALRKLQDFQPAAIVDLNNFCREMGFVSVGAKKLAALILGFRISKRQQTSNWEADTLSQAQLDYAATDAWICREISKKLPPPANGNGQLH